jgi:TRAP-type transport system periplasmic protein
VAGAEDSSLAAHAGRAARSTPLDQAFSEDEETMKFTRLVAAFCVGVSVLAAGAAGAQTRELKLAVGFPQGTAAYHGLEAFGKALKEASGGELEVRMFPLSLLNLPQMLNGVRDGVVDIGFVLPPLFPSDLPETHLAVDLAMLGSNPWAMAGAMTEYVFTCQECVAEHLKNNQVYMGSSSTAPYMLVMTKKAATLDEIKGKKLRSGAAPWARWAQHFGAVALTIPGNQVFEAVSGGTVDGAMVSAAELSNLRLIDVVKHITVGVPTGTYHGIDNNNFNLRTWRSLTEKQRRAALDASAMSTAAVTWKYVTDGMKNMKDSEAKGIQIHQAPPDVVARSKAFIESDLATIAQAAEKNSGIRNAAQKIDRFKVLLAKWEKLMPEKDWDPAALADIYRQEIFSKIDAKSYGM